MEFNKDVLWNQIAGGAEHEDGMLSQVLTELPELHEADENTAEKEDADQSDEEVGTNVPACREVAAVEEAPSIPRPNLVEKQPCSLSRPFDPARFPDQPRPGTNSLPGTISNLETLISVYGITVAYNAIKKKVEINIPQHIGTIENFENVTLTKICSLASLNGLPTANVAGYLQVIADTNSYNPVADWIISRPWDGQDRLAELCDTVSERDDFPVQLKNSLIIRWLISAVAAVFVPVSFKARGVLTFQGEQGIGKTSWLKALVNDPLLKETVVKIDHHLDVSNKDSILGAISHWLCEIGELDSSFKKDVARLKGFLTSDSDKIRRPYARGESEYPRRTVFFASVNRRDFLVDTTGNTRWWTIPVEKIGYQHPLDMQQVFAQLLVSFRKGDQWWLTLDEEKLLEQCNRDHLATSVIREKLLMAIDLDTTTTGYPALTATEVLVSLGFEKPSNAMCKECGGILRELFKEPKKINGIYRWRVPFKVPSLY